MANLCIYLNKLKSQGNKYYRYVLPSLSCLSTSKGAKSPGFLKALSHSANKLAPLYPTAATLC